MGRITNYLLGGSASPTVGDGYGVLAKSESPKSPNLLPSISTDLRPSSSKSSISPNLSPSILTDYFGPVDFEGSANTSQNPSPNPSNHPTDETLFGSSQHITRSPIAGKPVRIGNGVRALRSSLRSSLAPTPTATTPEESPHPSTESFHSAAQNSSPVEAAQNVEEIPWQDYEIPEELGLVKEDTPREIRNIIQESLDEHRAMRASRMQAQAEANFTPNRKAATLYTNISPVVAESSAMASARSTPGSENATNGSTSSLDVTQESDTSLESDAEADGFLKPPSNSLRPSSSNNSQESLGTEEMQSATPRAMTELERKFQESKLRTRKGYKIFKVLPGRKMKDEPTLPFLKSESAVSECISCFDDIPNKKAVDVPCGHKYCSGCFSSLISTAILSQDTFPPKCCLSEVPATTIRQHLPPKDMAKFNEKALEYAVPVANRYYCASPQCAKWIDARIAKRKNGALECPHCRKKLCTVCRGPQHPSNEDCPQDLGLDRTLEQAERAGWRRCFNCRAMVELNTGCRHITCKCKAEFCYTCGLRWRTCACTEADQARRELELRTRQTQFEADQRAEEEEVRAAIAAVEEAERAMQRERETEEARVEEEAREIERLEQERLSNIGDYYQFLRSVLERVRLHQRQEIEKRHGREWEEIDRVREDLESTEKAAERERTVNAEREKVIARTDGTIKILQRKHATTIMETITRHRRAQDDLLAASFDGPEVDAETLRAETYEQLMLAQELERSALKSQQAREIQKWRVRGEQALNDFDCKSVILQMRLKDLEDITKLEKELKTKVSADSKWFDLLFSERITMLSEDETRMIRSGAEAPAAPRRSTVIVSGKEAVSPAAVSVPGTFSAPRQELPTAQSVREQLGITPRPQTYQNSYRGVNKRGRRFEPDWEDLHQIAAPNGRGADETRANWKRSVVGLTVRVG